MNEFDSTVEQFVAECGDHHQLAQRAKNAARTVHAGLVELSSMGMSFVIAPRGSEPHSAEEFPKMLFSDTIPPGELIVNDSAEEAKAKAEGWASRGEVVTEEDEDDN